MDKQRKLLRLGDFFSHTINKRNNQINFSLRRKEAKKFLANPTKLLNMPIPKYFIKKMREAAE